MEINGYSNDGKMGEKVEKVLSALGVNEDSGHLFLVKVPKDGIINNDRIIEGGPIEWSDARQAILFLINEDYTLCTIRHITEDYCIHKQFIGEHGLRICVEDWRSPMELCLYQNKTCESRRKITDGSFREDFKFIYQEYYLIESGIEKELPETD